MLGGEVHKIRTSLTIYIIELKNICRVLYSPMPYMSVSIVNAKIKNKSFLKSSNIKARESEFLKIKQKLPKKSIFLRKRLILVDI